MQDAPKYGGQIGLLSKLHTVTLLRSGIPQASKLFDRSKFATPEYMAGICPVKELPAKFL
jgi:hypothetical protein